MRVRRSLGLVASALLAVGSVACAALTGLSDYSDGDASVHTVPDASLMHDARAPDGASSDDVSATEYDATDDGTSTELPDAAPLDGALGDAGADDADGSELPDTGPPDAGDAGAGDAGPDANDGGPSCGCSPALCCGPFCSPKHTNGVGQSYYDCSLLGTTTSTTAHEACEAAGNASPCGPKNLSCGLDGMLTAQCVITTSGCTCWGYTASGAGHVNSSTIAGLCVCPGGLDPTWN